MKKTALVIGASGLVGTELMKLLTSSNDYSKIILLGRKIIGYSNERIQEVVVDFNNLSNTNLERISDVFCCLGTTIKKAKTKESFKRVDLDYVIKTAELGKKNGADKFLVVSAVGADKSSSIFYNLVKGEMEHKVQSLGYSSVFIFRPSMLGGNRKEFRLGEKIGSILLKLFGWLLVGKLKRYRIVPAQNVAKSMIDKAQSNLKSTHIIESEDM